VKKNSFLFLNQSGMVMNKLIVFTIMSLCLYTNVAYAYTVTKTEHHQKITKKAIAEFKKYQKQKLAEEIEKIIVAGCVGEDKVLSTFRWRNWHFLHPKEELGKKWFIMNQSMLPRFCGLDKRLHRLIKEYKETNSEAKRKKLLKEIYRQIGRIIHYLQDVSVPAHVVPIYHGPGSPDKFDGYEYEYGPECEEGEKSVDLEMEKGLTLKRLLRKSACATVKSIGEGNTFYITKDGKEVLVTWEVFWSKPRSEGFSEYGILKNNFGVSRIRDDKGHEYLVEDNVYKRFFGKQYRQAINTTIKALLYLQEQLDN
jgi:hypothetical protein